MTSIDRRIVLAPMSAGLATAALFAADKPAPGERWAKLRQSMFGDRSISDKAGDILALNTLQRAQDAADVPPIAIRTRMAQSPERYIKKLYLVIDNDPSPAGAVSAFSFEAGQANIETRVRVQGIHRCPRHRRT